MRHFRQSLAWDYQVYLTDLAFPLQGLPLHMGAGATSSVTRRNEQERIVASD